MDLPHANCQDACPVAGALDFVLEKTQSIHPCLALLHKMGAMDIDTKCVSSVPVSRAVFPDVKLLTAAQKQYLIQAVCADKSTNVLSAPKVTLFQGQTADMLFGAGRNFQVSGKVSQTKQVFVTLGFGDSDSAGSSRPFSGILNDGESVLFPAPSGCCSDSLCESCDAEFYIVTPRILILHDEEECKPVH